MSKRKPSVSALLAKRERENDALKDARAKLVGERAAIDAQIAQIDRLLGAGAEGSEVSLGSSRQPGGMRKCADCEAYTLPNAENECPKCGASPFEVAH